MSKASLRLELTHTLALIQVQFDEIGRDAVNMGIQPHQMRNIDGGFTIVPLLVARAQVLAAMASLES